MARFDDWKRYVTDLSLAGVSGLKHEFFPLEESQILREERRLGRRFPAELRELYVEFGYGFVNVQNRVGIDRLMDPNSVVDFHLAEDIYQDAPDCEFCNLPGHLVFFEASEGLFLSLNLDQEDDNGICPVYDYDRMIARSLLEFLGMMDQDPNYFVRTG